MSADDWLVANDDAFTARLTHCTVCGRRVREIYFDIWAPAALQRAVGVAVCLPCHATPAWRQAVETVMQRRYGQGGSSAEAMNEERHRHG